MVQCKHCGTNKPKEQTIERTMFDGRRWLTYYYCGRHCLETWYINQLRMLGL